MHTLTELTHNTVNQGDGWGETFYFVSLADKLSSKGISWICCKCKYVRELNVEVHTYCQWNLVCHELSVEWWEWCVWLQGHYVENCTSVRLVVFTLVFLWILYLLYWTPLVCCCSTHMNWHWLEQLCGVCWSAVVAFILACILSWSVQLFIHCCCVLFRVQFGKSFQPSHHSQVDKIKC